MSLSYTVENGSPNTLLIIAGIGLLGFLVWKLFFSGGSSGPTIPTGPASFETKLSSLAGSFQTGISSMIFDLAGTEFPVTYNGSSVNFTISQISSGDEYQGIALISSDETISIYMTYYEYLIWTSASPSADRGATLTVPARTLLTGDIMSNNGTGGYSIKSASPFVITSLTGSVAAGLVDSTGATVSLTTLPTPPTPTGFDVRFSDLPDQFKQIINNRISGAPFPIQYDGSNTGYILSQIPGGVFQGLVLTSPNRLMTLYMTYYEYLNWTCSGPNQAMTLTIPARNLLSSVIRSRDDVGYTITTVFNQSNTTMTEISGPFTVGLTSASGTPVSITTLLALP